MSEQPLTEGQTHLRDRLVSTNLITGFLSVWTVGELSEEEWNRGTGFYSGTNFILCCVKMVISQLLPCFYILDILDFDSLLLKRLEASAARAKPCKKLFSLF